MARTIEASRRTLELDFILDDQGLALVVNLLGELGGDGVVSSRILDNKTLVTLDTLEDGRLLDGPLANVGPILIGFGVLLLGVRGSPTFLPVISELLKERSFEGGGLLISLVVFDLQVVNPLTRKDHVAGRLGGNFLANVP
jgi:hypothetical protein